MFKNYLKTAYRNLIRYKAYSAINIVGLAIGTAACLLIYLYVQKDLSFDQFNKNHNHIYRVVQEWDHNGKEATWAITPAGYANAFSNEFPGTRTVRITSPGLYKPVLKWKNHIYETDKFLFADSSFFNVFTYPLLEGNPRTALSQPLSLVITKSEARKIFGHVDPVGKTIRLANKFNLKITGVAKDPPTNSSIQFHYLGSLVSLKDITNHPDILNNMNASNYHTFVLLPRSLNAMSITQRLPGFTDKYLGKKVSKMSKLFLEPISDFHFKKNLLFDFPNKGDIRYDYILSAIALFILLIACVNFINISTARSSARTKEIGLRKVLGANRPQLVWQFLLEFVLLAMISVFLAVCMVELLLPAFNALSGLHLSAGFITDPHAFFPFFILWTVVVLLGSSYPSLYLSGIHPARVINNFFGHMGSGSFVRKSLIIFQFAVSVFLIAGTIVMWSQYHFLKSHKLGFDGHQVIFMSSNSEISGSYDAFKQNLLQSPDIHSVSRANWVPGDPHDIEGYSWIGKSSQKSGSFYTLFVDPDYAKTMGLKIATGRNFSWKMPTDWKNSFVVNRAATEMMGWDMGGAIGHKIRTIYHPQGRIIGVVEDFNFKSLQHGIEPVVMSMDSSLKNYNTLAFKISGHHVAHTIDFLKSTWKKFSPDFPFNYHFLDQSFDQLYRSEQRMNGIFSSFSILSILIACLGLFGLAAFAAEQRTKEIGIRKAVGASVLNIVTHLSKDFLKLVGIGFLIAVPIAWYAMHRWLQNFAYHIHIGIGVFLLAGVFAMVIALATVSWQSIKAALANPVESLRNE